jgi:hypothetical protein
MIYIPQPCHEDWNAMAADEQGRHCGACQQIVIDFSTWSIPEIQRYIVSHHNICGRVSKDFTTQSVVKSDNFLISDLLQSGLTFIQKVAAIIVLCLNLTPNIVEAQQNNTKYKDSTTNMVTVKPIKDSTRIKSTPIIVDSLKRTPEIKPMIMGKMVTVPKTQKG